MIKAILVIEIEHDDFDDIEKRGMTIPTIDLYSKKSGERLKAYSDLILRPLPNKDFVDEAESYQTESEYKAYVNGWNDCIMEILDE